jgi:hypothetical protein
LKSKGDVLSRFEPNLVVLGEKKWSQIHNKVRSISRDPFANNDTAKAELDRLDRATEFISQTVVSAYPFADFINPDIQNHVNNLENRLSQLGSAQPNQLPGIVTQLNNEITTVLDRLSPYLSNADSARSAGQALGRYKRLVEQQEKEIRTIRAKIDESLEVTETAKNRPQTTGESYLTVLKNSRAFTLTLMISLLGLIRCCRRRRASTKD